MHLVADDVVPNRKRRLPVVFVGLSQRLVKIVVLAYGDQVLAVDAGDWRVLAKESAA